MMDLWGRPMPTLEQINPQAIQRHLSLDGNQRMQTAGMMRMISNLKVDKSEDVVFTFSRLNRNCLFYSVMRNPAELVIMRKTARLVHVQVEMSLIYRGSEILTSKPFKIGLWDWSLKIGKVDNAGGGNPYQSKPHVSLCPSIESSTKHGAPVASFTVRVLARWTPHVPRVSKEYPRILNDVGVTVEAVVDLLITKDRDYIWELCIHEIKACGATRFIIEIEFQDLKCSTLRGQSIWTRGSLMHSHAQEGFSRMLEDGLHTDVTIITSNDGSIGAHRAVLGARSPVFNTMFTNNWKEQHSSTVHIDDMTLDGCRAFLRYLYGNLVYEEFAEHRLALLQASDKYDIPELKLACGKALLEDITTENVLARLQYAWKYKVNDLKHECLCYLLDFGKVHDMEGEFYEFVGQADIDLTLEIVKKQTEILRSICK